MRRVRYHSELGQWESYFRAPEPRLREHVRGPYQGWTERASRPVRRREVPADIVPLILNLGPAFGLIDPGNPEGSAEEHGSFVAGLSDSFGIVESSGTSMCVQVNLTPIGAHRIFGLPMHALTNRVVDLESVVGSAGGALLEKLHEAAGWDERFTLIDSFLGQRLARSRLARADVAWAWRRLHEAGGCVSVGALAAELGHSRKHLVSLFREQIGLPPKTIARVLRFNRAVALLRGACALRWAEIAQECGYYDQAHFNRDFREFAGSSPTEFLDHRLPDGGVGAG